MHPRTLLRMLCCCALASAAAAQVPFRRTFLGGSGYERVQGVTFDAQGLVYVAGHTTSTVPSALFHGVPGGYDTTFNGGLDGYVAVFTPDMRTLLRWTLLGGSGEDRAYQVELDSGGQVVVVGLTGSTNFPRTGGAPLRGGWDVFVARFSRDLGQLNVSTLLGGSGNENPRGSFTLDAAGNVFIGGHTTSFDFPVTPGALQAVHAPALPDDWDAFVAKLSPTGQTVWATYLGGSLNDSAHSGVRLAPDGSVIVAGMTNSPDFPTTPGSLQPTFAGHGALVDPYIGDGFVARLTPDGTQFVFSTFLGGSETDNVAANDSLELDAAGNPVVIGQTRSPDFPIVGAAYDDQYHGATSDRYDGYVAVLALDGSHLIASTYLGGSQSEEPSGLALSASGDVYLSGNTGSSDFPVSLDASQPFYGGGPADAFVAKLTHDLRFLVYSSFVGGGGVTGVGDRGRGLALLPSGDVVLGGDTDSSNFPVTSLTFDTTYGGGTGDGFIGVEALSTSAPFGMSKANSNGQIPSLRMFGTPSSEAGLATLQVTNAMPGERGFLCFGRHLVAVPYQGGTLYMGPPVARVTPSAQLDPVGAVSIDVPIEPAMVGETRIYQFWYRDPQQPDGTGVGLTNALRLTFVP